MREAVLLVDLDGTLADNYAGISRSIVYALEHLGHEVPDVAELRRCVGPPLRHTFARLLGTQDRAAIERAIGLYRERYSDVGWRENLVYEGVVDAMARLAGQTARMFICTSKPAPFAQRIVDEFGLGGDFAAIYGADLAGALDDKAKLVAHVLAQEGIAVERAIMIGDREHDVRAAQANALLSIGVLWGYGTREELAAADALVSAPSQLPDAVTAL